MIDLHPTKCNLCGGQVIFTSNALIYGKEYGSGRMYFCTNCHAYVGTHKPRPEEAMGILADSKMRTMKNKCHKLFDAKWLGAKDRRGARKISYTELAEKMAIDVSECHFGYFDLEQLEKAYLILKGER